MCGIAGFCGEGDLTILKKMTDKIRHRGPDADGHWKDDKHPVFLGHRRLSIVDLAGGVQPMYDSNEEYVLTFNGEIYNHQVIREELEKLGYKFKTKGSDTETLLVAYKHWGVAMLEKLNGMWAFAIWDIKKKELFLSRDRFGKKPLFYSHDGSNFKFSSELNSLTEHPQAPRELNQKALQKYFAFGYIPAPNSLIKGIQKLPGGYWMKYSPENGDLIVKKFWEFELDPFDKRPKDPVKEWGEEMIDLLDKAIQRRLMSEVPLGFFLSGGIDSSAVVALASQKLGGENVNSFSIGFADQSFDESPYSKLIAEKFGTKHRSAILNLEEGSKLIPSILKKLDEPMGDSSLLPTYLLCRETRKHVTVALGGDGADELFCGYDPFQALQKAKLYDSLVPKPLHKAIYFMAQRMPVSHKNMSLDFKIKRTLRGLSYPQRFWNAVWMGPLDPVEINDLFNEELDMEELYAEGIAAWDGCKQDSLLDKATEFYVKTYLQDDILVKVDRASMMNSLEVRAPFLDIDFVNFVRRIPVQYKYHKGETKYILKKALEKILPNEILYRPKKGFGVPIGKWLAGDQLLPEVKEHSNLNNDFVQRMHQEHQGLKADHRAFLWNLMAYEHNIREAELI